MPTPMPVKPLVTNNTPVEKYCTVDGWEYYVKREDLACPPPGPPFAKVRGLYRHLLMLKQQGVSVVGYMDTSISMSGWAVAYFAKSLGIKPVIFYPKYKKGLKYNQPFQLQKWEEHNAKIVPVPHPTQHQVNIYRARKLFLSMYPDGVWLPYGLVFPETVEEVAQEVVYVIGEIPFLSLVVCTGSGTMLAGILRGLSNCGYRAEIVFGVCPHNKQDIKKVERHVLRMAGFADRKVPSLFTPSVHTVTERLQIVLGNYNYYVPASGAEPPFPCNPYYDKKAYEYMLSIKKELVEPVLFWNIGA